MFSMPVRHSATNGLQAGTAMGPSPVMGARFACAKLGQNKLPRRRPSPYRSRKSSHPRQEKKPQLEQYLQALLPCQLADGVQIGHETFAFARNQEGHELRAQRRHRDKLHSLVSGADRFKATDFVKWITAALAAV